MKKNKLLSIIVPVFNAEQTIYDCLMSLLNQTYKPIEIIVIYRKSIDNTLNIINSFNNENIQIINQIENTGPGGARNLGIKFAQGSFVAFAEADDIVSYNFYDLLINKMVFEKSQICWGEILIKYNDGGKSLIGHQDDSILQGSFYFKLRNAKNGASFDKVYDLDFIKSNNIYFSEYYRWEDNLFFFKSFFFAHKISRVTGVYYIYRPREWSNEYRNILQKDAIIISMQIMDFFSDKHLSYSDMYVLKYKIYKFYGKNFIDDELFLSKFSKILNSPPFIKFIKLKKFILLVIRKIKGDV